MSDLPHLTVATIIEDNGRFLMIKEFSQQKLVINQPAGHVDPNETVAEAAIRETYEETGYEVELTGIIGIYHYLAPNNVDYCRIAFAAKVIEQKQLSPPDNSIQEALWLDFDSIKNDNLRSVLVTKCIEDYLNKPHYPLDMCKGYFRYD